jgi:hypothetical protein
MTGSAMRLEGWTGSDLLPSFETRAYGALLRMRTEKLDNFRA